MHIGSGRQGDQHDKLSVRNWQEASVALCRFTWTKYVLQTLGRSRYLYCSQQDPSSLVVRPGPLSMSVLEQQSVVGLWACEYMNDSELQATLDRPGDLFLATHHGTISAQSAARAVCTAHCGQPLLSGLHPGIEAVLLTAVEAGSSTSAASVADRPHTR